MQTIPVRVFFKRWARALHHWKELSQGYQGGCPGREYGGRSALGSQGRHFEGLSPTGNLNSAPRRG